MKKILISLFSIVAVLGAASAATYAYFSDTETSVDNTITTGTIDIAVDGTNPWTREIPYHLEDLKPSQTDYIDFEVVNVGSNPLNLWKSLENYSLVDEVVSEPECDAEGGNWVDGTSGYCSGRSPVSDIDNWINYDMRVELYTPEGDEPVWWETIYTDEDNVKLGELEDEPMYLGMIPVGWRMKVMQSYHVVSETGNAYQGDGMVFDIKLYAEQLTNTIRLENKYLSNTDVSHHIWDDIYGDLTYKVKDRELAFTLDVTGLPDGNYTLVTWEDPSYSWSWGNFAGTTILADVVVSGGTAHVESSLDLGKNITNSKVWLVPGDLGDAGDVGVALPDWTTPNVSRTLFETGLMDYYDADL